MDKIPNGQYPKPTKSWTDKISNRQNVEWTETKKSKSQTDKIKKQKNPPPSQKKLEE